MKRIAALALAGLLISAVCVTADPTPTPTPTPTPSPTKEKEGTIAGIAIPREQGGWLGLELVDQSFRLTFYNAKKHPVAADKASAVLWWPVHYQPNVERTELTPTDNSAILASPYPIRPPYGFKLHITLLSEGEAPEEHILNFKSAASDGSS